MPTTLADLSVGIVLHVNYPIGYPRPHYGVVLEIVGQAARIAVSTSEPGKEADPDFVTRIDWNKEPDRSTVNDWPRDDPRPSYHYGFNVKVLAAALWKDVVGTMRKRKLAEVALVYRRWKKREGIVDAVAPALAAQAPTAPAVPPAPPPVPPPVV